MANVTIKQLNAIGEDVFSGSDLFIVYNSTGNTTLKMTGNQLISYINNNTSLLPVGATQTSLSSYLEALEERIAILEDGGESQPQSQEQPQEEPEEEP